jgi:hypothetical protein
MYDIDFISLSRKKESDMKKFLGFLTLAVMVYIFITSPGFLTLGGLIIVFSFFLAL